jgi:hypothetical protein
MRKMLPWALAGLMLAAPAVTRSQTNSTTATKNTDQARAVLNAMVQALGGQAWLNIRNMESIGHLASFYEGRPQLGTTEYFHYHQWPDYDRIEYTKHRDDVLFFIGNQGWEVDYQGKKQLPKDQLDGFLRRRAHSIETVVKRWMKDPKTILIYEGPRLVQRNLGVQVSLISATNQAVTIVVNVNSHLPLRSEFKWRDPAFHTIETEDVEYDDYHTIDGFPTPLTITVYKDGEMVQQRFRTAVKYNQTLPADFWNPDVAARHIKK